MGEPQDFQWPGCPQCEQWCLREFVTEVGLSVLCRLSSVLCGALGCGMRGIC